MRSFKILNLRTLLALRGTNLFFNVQIDRENDFKTVVSILDPCVVVSGEEN